MKQHLNSHHWQHQSRLYAILPMYLAPKWVMCFEYFKCNIHQQFVFLCWTQVIYLMISLVWFPAKSLHMVKKLWYNLVVPHKCTLEQNPFRMDACHSYATLPLLLERESLYQPWGQINDDPFDIVLLQFNLSLQGQVPSRSLTTEVYGILEHTHGMDSGPCVCKVEFQRQNIEMAFESHIGHVPFNGAALKNPTFCSSVCSLSSSTFSLYLMCKTVNSMNTKYPCIMVSEKHLKQGKL